MHSEWNEIKKWEKASVVAVAGAGAVVEDVTPSTNAKNHTAEATFPAQSLLAVVHNFLSMLYWPIICYPTACQQMAG